MIWPFKKKRWNGDYRVKRYDYINGTSKWEVQTRRSSKHITIWQCIEICYSYEEAVKSCDEWFGNTPVRSKVVAE